RDDDSHRNLIQPNDIFTSCHHTIIGAKRQYTTASRAMPGNRRNKGLRKRDQFFDQVNKLLPECFHLLLIVLKERDQVQTRSKETLFTLKDNSKNGWIFL